MTVSELIGRILEMLETQFYCEQPVSHWGRDFPYLMAAIGTYGWECQERGWELDVDFIYRDLCGILLSFKRSGTEVKWMPNFLQHTIRQHIREHAEELQRTAQASGVAREVRRIEDAVRPVVIVEKTAVEMMGSIYKDVRQMRRERQKAVKQSRGERKKQGSLL